MAEFFAAGLGSNAKSPYNPLEWASLFAKAQEAETAWTVPEAFCILFTAATCDGDVDRLEHEELLALAHRSRALSTLTIQNLAAVKCKRRRTHGGAPEASA